MKKRILSLVLAIAMVIPFAPVIMAADIIANGDCGVDLTWTLDNNGTLIISGTGEMWDYYNNVDTPSWYSEGDVKKVKIENGVTSIGDYAFYCSADLISIDIPHSVTSIGTAAFRSCTSLIGVSIPDGVEYIGTSAFNGCTALTDIKIPGSVTNIEDSVFYECSSLTDISLPDGITRIGTRSFNNCTSLTDINIPDNVTDIGNYAFDGCTGLTGITIPESVTNIGFKAFSRDNNLISVVINNPETAIGNYAFDECSDSLVIYGYADSSAETYARENDISFSDLSFLTATTAPVQTVSPLSSPSVELANVTADTASDSMPEGVSAKIINKTNHNVSGQIITAYKSAAGELLKADFSDINLSEGEELDYSDVSTVSSAESAEIFIWDSVNGMIPIANKKSVNIDGFYTRAEWINLLMNKVDAEVLADDTQTNYYADIENSRYEHVIEAARSYGILPEVEDVQDVPEFDPDSLADREFAAVTAVLAMGYVSNDSVVDCYDVSEIQHPDLISIAVDEGFLSLESGNFYPENPVRTSEKNQIFEAIDEINESEKITEEIEDITYTNDVIAEPLKNITDYSVTDNGNDLYTVKVIKNASTEAITNEKYFILPPNDEYISGIALKAISIREENGYLIIEAQRPEDISKIMSSVVFSGEATADVDGVKILDDNITYSYDPEGTISDEEAVDLYGSVGGSFSVPGKWTFDFGDGVKIGSHATLKGNTEVTIPDITAYLDADFGWFNVDVNELTVSITEKAQIKGELEYVVMESQYSESYSGAKEFARVPFALGATGLSIDLVFSLYYDIKGSVSIVYTVEATQGVQYKDNNFRFIHNFDSQLEIPKIEGSGQVGLQPAINLVFCGIWDIVGINGQIGAAGTVSVVNHADEDLCCIDGTIYLAAKIGLNQDTLIGDFLKTKKHYTLEKEIFTSDNSPLKLKLHFENLHKVPECTYGQGKITGYVYDAVSHEPIKYARVSIYKGDDLKAVKYTNAEGLYTVESGLPVGEVSIKISATGYRTYTDNRQVNKNVVTYIESYMMVGRSDEGLGNVRGSFINALTGEKVKGVTYEVRSGWNNTSGDLLITASADETYSFDIISGNYTIKAIADEFVSNSVNVTVTDGACVQSDITLSPEDSGSIDSGNNLRFVLTWGETPRDLDSHLFGPTADGTGIFHTYFYDQNYYENMLMANLDLDDIDSYGPETTTIYKLNSSGKYSFYVHDYTNKESSSCNAMSLSGAKVVIYNGNTRYATFNIPVNTNGTVWHVFDYDAATGVITPINTMTYSSTPGNLGLYSATENDFFNESKAIEAIRECSKEEKITDGVN